MKRLLSVLVFVLVLTFAFSAFADYQTVEVYVNGELLVADSPAILAGSRTMVPLRAISEKLGCDVAWDDAAQTATISNSKTAVYVTIDSDIMIKKDLEADKSEEIKIDAPAMLYKQRTLIPLRAVSEALDATVEWDSEKECALITTTVYEAYYGTVSETGYVSKELGIKFTASENVQMMHYTEDVEVSEYTDDVEIADSESAAEFSAFNVVSGSNVAFAVSPKTSVTAAEYLEYIRPYLEGTSNGVTYVAAPGTQKFELAGYEFEKIEFVVTTGETILNMDYCAGNINGRLVFAVIVYVDDAEVDAQDFIGGFSRIE